MGSGPYLKRHNNGNEVKANYNTLFLCINTHLWHTAILTSHKIPTIEPAYTRTKMSNIPIVSNNYTLRLRNSQQSSAGEQPVTLRIDNDLISFVFEASKEVKEDELPENSSEVFDITSVAILLIEEPETDDIYQATVQRKSTLHEMLSDGDIVRIPRPNKMQAIILEPVNRVCRAILGAILAHCNRNNRVLDRRVLARVERGFSSGTIPNFSFNKYELLKIFHTIEPVICSSYPGYHKPMYKIRPYSEDEIASLAATVFMRGRTFSVDPVCEAQRQTYLRGLERQAPIGGVPTGPLSKLMILALAANAMEEEDRTKKLCWD